MLLGISTCCTASGFLHFFNYIGIILLFCGAALHQVQDDREWGVLQYVKKFFLWRECGSFQLRNLSEDMRKKKMWIKKREC